MGVDLQNEDECNFNRGLFRLSVFRELETGRKSPWPNIRVLYVGYVGVKG